jgi:hypothetical protein
MFTKTAIVLAIIAGASSDALAANKQNSTPNWDVYNCRGVHVGTDPKLLINRPQNGMCDRVEE